jgi:hypothetical protein
MSLPNVAHWRLRLDLALLGRWNPIGDDQSAHRPWRDPHVRFFGTKNLRNMLRETGFDPVEVGGLEAAFLQHVPALRRLARRQTAGPVYKRLTRAVPSLFARYLYAVATKPDRLRSA